LSPFFFSGELSIKGFAIDRKQMCCLTCLWQKKKTQQATFFCPFLFF
jgi:hypothetical protein